MAVAQGRVPRRFYIHPGEGEYRVDPPMPVVRPGDTATWINTTRDYVVLLLPSGLMAGGYTGQVIPPDGEMPDPAATIDASAKGAYYYIVAIIRKGPDRNDKQTDHGFVLARGNSSPGMMVDY